MRVFDSLRGRTAAIVVLGLVVSNGLGYAIYSRDKQESLILQDAFDMSERAAGVSRLLRDIPDDWNADIVGASDSRAFRVWFSDAAPFVNDAPSDDEAALAAYVAELVPRIRDNDIRVWFRPSLPDGVILPVAAMSAGTGEVNDRLDRWSFVLSINHEAGEWLNVHGHSAPAASFLPTFLALNLLTAVFGLGVVALWLVNRVTAPLKDLAQAAERLGRDLTVEPLREVGPAEVRVAARAFNAMQARLMRQIEGRTGMLAAISHDLRTPITQVRLRTELAPDSPERTKTLTTLDEMNTIIGTFLDFARVSSDAEPRAFVDLGSLVGSICDDFADGGADVSFHEHNALTYWCKRVAMKRALSNVIRNALVYGQCARVAMSHEGTDILVSIEDNGPGIPESQMEAVFQPFRRLGQGKTRHSGGVGLGLSIAQSIVEDHGGTISLINNLGGGLRVEVRLPAGATAPSMERRRVQTELRGN